MKQKRVSFKVAKAIKEAGYPQIYIKNHWYYYNEELVIPDNIEDFKVVDCIAPTYLEVWLWLWKEKMVQIDITSNSDYSVDSSMFIEDEFISEFHGSNPEEAIIAATEYLVDNNLIK